MGEAIITRRAGGGSTANLLIALWWGYWGPSTTVIYSDSAYGVVSPVDSDYFTFEAGTQNLIANKAMDVKIMPIVRGSRNGSGTSKEITYKIYKNTTVIVTQSNINITAATLTDDPTSVSLSAGDVIKMSTVANITGTAAIEAGFFIELQ